MFSRYKTLNIGTILTEQDVPTEISGMMVSLFDLMTTVFNMLLTPKQALKKMKKLQKR